MGHCPRTGGVVTTQTAAIVGCDGMSHSWLLLILLLILLLVLLMMAVVVKVSVMMALLLMAVVATTRASSLSHDTFSRHQNSMLIK